MLQAYDYGDSVENSKWENDSKGYSIMLVLFSTGITGRIKKSAEICPPWPHQGTVHLKNRLNLATLLKASALFVVLISIVSYITIEL
jgi:hypothetical protein